MVRLANSFVKGETTRYCVFLLGQSQYIDIVSHQCNVLRAENRVRNVVGGPPWRTLVAWALE
jgi:hypothetical protein